MSGVELYILVKWVGDQFTNNEIRSKYQDLRELLSATTPDPEAIESKTNELKRALQSISFDSHNHEKKKFLDNLGLGAQMVSKAIDELNLIDKNAKEFGTQINLIDRTTKIINNGMESSKALTLALKTPVTTGEEFPFTHDSDHLNILQIIYSIGFTLGIIFSFKTAYEVHTKNILSSDSVIFIYVIAIALTFMGLRMFFAVEALSEYLIQRKLSGKGQLSYRLTLVHYPALLAHAIIFYNLYLSFSTLTSEILETHTTLFTRDFICFYIGLLALNAVWLIILTGSKSWERVKKFGAIICRKEKKGF